MPQVAPEAPVLLPPDLCSSGLTQIQSAAGSKQGRRREQARAAYGGSLRSGTWGRSGWARSIHQPLIPKSTRKTLFALPPHTHNRHTHLVRPGPVPPPLQSSPCSPSPPAPTRRRSTQRFQPLRSVSAIRAAKHSQARCIFGQGADVTTYYTEIASWSGRMRRATDETAQAHTCENTRKSANYIEI
jgi:hypothetical protein